MSVELEIEDGSPWYLSPNVWTVPGANPEGLAGPPVVGEPCYMWARVRNNGRSQAQNATVRFYWADPSVGFDRNTAHFIGTSNVTLAPGETREVLCLTSWLPAFVNEGHICVLAEAFHATADPLPPTPVFNVPTDRRVAQRNLQVAMAYREMNMMFSASFQVCNSSRKASTFRVSAKEGRLAELKPLVEQFGLKKLSLSSKGSLKDVGFVSTPCPQEKDIKQAIPLLEKLEVAGNTYTGLSVVGKLEGEAALLHIIQESNGKEIGGLSILVLNGDTHPVKNNKELKKGRA